MQNGGRRPLEVAPNICWSSASYRTLWDAEHGLFTILPSIAPLIPDRIQQQRNEVFLQCCRDGSFEEAKSLFNKKSVPTIQLDDGCEMIIVPQISVCDPVGNDAVLLALQHESGRVDVETKILEFLRFLVEKGAHLRTVNIIRDALLILAARRGFLAVIRYALTEDRELDLNHANEAGQTPLLAAVTQKHGPIVTCLSIEYRQRIKYEVMNQGALALAFQCSEYEKAQVEIYELKRRLSAREERPAGGD